MKTRISIRLAAWMLAVCALAAGVSARAAEAARADAPKADAYNPAALAKTIAPFIESETFALFRLDATRIDVAAAFDTLARLFPESTDQFTRAKAETSAIAEQFRKNGGKDLYYVFSTTLDMRRPPVVVIPLAAGVDEKAILAGMPNPGPTPVVRIGDAAVIAFEDETIARLKTAKPDVRPELTAAFEAAGDSAVQVLLLPPKHFARVFDETMPELPAEVGGGSGKILSQGLKWAAVGVTLPPKTAGRLVVQSQDAQAAEALLKKANEVVKIVGQRPEVKKFVPKFDQLVASLVPKVEGNRVVLAVDETGAKNIISLMQPAVEAARGAARRAQSANNLKQIALAMHNYHDTYRAFPPAAVRDKNGKALLSWRVLMLPYIEQEALYKQFHLDEPWDSAHNKALLAKMPAVFRSPMSKLADKDRTNYVVPVGTGTVFANIKGPPISDIRDGTSNTIMTLEVDDTHAVLWTKPDDLEYDPKEPLKGLGGLYPEGFNAGYCDGSVRFISKSIDLKVLRALMTASGQEPVDPF